MKHGYIYLITHIPTGRYYIGQRRSEDPDNDKYMGSGTEWKRILAAHPAEEFSKKILARTDDQEELNKLEEKFVGDLYNTDNKCKNLMSGGRIHTWSDESRKKLSKSLLGRPSHLSAEERVLRSKRMSGAGNYFYGKHTVGKDNPFYGHRHTDETKQKIREKNLGRTLSEETRRRMSESRKGRVFTQEHKRRISEARKGRHFLTEDGKRRIGEANRGLTRTKELRALWSEQRKGRHWYNDGTSELFTYSCPDGFSVGRLKR